jgi:FKBP-type peptidyl-prolyl cis-trans isomerase SlyD
VTIVQPNAFVVVEYTLHDESGDVIDGSSADLGGEAIEYVHGYGMLVPGLELGLEGLKAGDTKDIHVTPEQGFGLRDEELVMLVDREDFPPDVAAGDEFIAEADDGEEAVMHVLEVRDDGVVVDGNHPLAGENLKYVVKVTSVRAATAEEIEKAAKELTDAEEQAVHEEPPPEVVQLGAKKNLLN